MKRIYLFAVLIFCTFTVSSKAQDTIIVKKVNKNTVYVNFAGSFLKSNDFIRYDPDIDIVYDLNYTRNFNKVIRGNVGFKYVTTKFEESRPLFYIGVGVDLKLFKELYLVPKIDLGYTHIPEILVDNIGITQYNLNQDAIWAFLLQGGLNFEYRFNSSWRAVVGADYNYIFKDDGAYPKNSLTLKLGAGFSF